MKSLVYVEVDVPYCSLTYGTSPCTAAAGAGFPTGGIEAAVFDGSNDYLTRDAGITGASDGKAFTVAGVFRKLGGDGVNQRLLVGVSSLGGTADSGIIVQIGTDDRLRFIAEDASGNILLNAATSATATVAGGWIAFAASFDLSDTNKRHIIVNGSDDLSTVSTYVDDVIDMTIADWGVGGEPDGSNLFNGAVGFLWFDDQYLDLSDADVLSLFFDGAVPRYLGTTGQAVTGSSPLVYLAGAVSAWPTNKGTGGGFTLNGTLGTSVFGTGARKCFNTIATCQDRANFDDAPVTLRFAKPAAYRPSDIEVLAASLVSVDITPGRVSLGEDLGQRATLTAVFKDHPWSDTGPGGDKYLADRTYDPYRQGSFFGKFRARQKFLIGAPLRYIRGELGQTLAGMETRHYFVESIDGPDTDGTFRIVAKDLLKFADNDRALAPTPNSGHLLSGITAEATSATLAPSGIGALEYPTSGYAAIGAAEIVQFFRDTTAGNDANTLLLLHLDGANASTTITDSSASARTVTVLGNAKLSTGTKKFGTASLDLDGTTDYLTVPDSADWAFSGNFTIEAQIRAASISTSHTIVAQGTDVSNLWRFRVTSVGALQWQVVTAGSAIVAVTSSSGAIATGTWYHVAIVRVGTTYTLYIDGVSAGSTTDADAIPNYSGALSIGAETGGGGGGNAFNGFIDEVRISNVARWTTGFTPPSQPWLSSADELYLVRAQRDTEAVAHDADDGVQVGLEYAAQSAADIIRDLLVNYAAVDASYITLANWQAEITTYLGVLHTRRIFVPTGVRELVSDLIREAALAMWWDDLTPQLRLMVLRAVPTGAGRFSPDNIMAGSFSSREQPEKRLSEVQVIYGLRNPLLPLDQPDSYRSREIVVDLGAEADYGSPAILQIYARWIPAFGSSIAQELGERVLSRYRDPPRQFSFSVLRNGQDQIDLGDSYHLEWWTLQDDTGALADVPVQAIEVSSLQDRFTGVLEEVLSDVDDAEAELDRVITIDSDVDNLDLLEIYETLYPSPTTDDVSDGVTVRFVIYEGVTVGSTSRTVPALSTGVWPTGFVPTLEVNGRIQGAGGTGGAVASASPANGKPGLSGGTALLVEDAIVLEGAGEIFGGGGGGGSGVYAEKGGGGGGGAGSIPGAGGTAPSGSVAGSSGTTSAGGAGGNIGTADGGNGGAGGGPGDAGTAGEDDGIRTGGAGGAAGKAVDGWSNVTDSSTIDFQGAQSG